MKPDDTTFETWLEPELEARLVALVLGEASDFEREELERLMKEQPMVEAFYRVMQDTHGLVEEAGSNEAMETWKLSTDRRETILKKFREGGPSSASSNEKALPTITQKHPAFRWKWVAVAAVIACSLSLAALPFLSRTPYRQVAATETARGFKAGKPTSKSARGRALGLVVSTDSASTKGEIQNSEFGDVPWGAVVDYEHPSSVVSYARTTGGTRAVGRSEEASVTEEVLGETLALAQAATEAELDEAQDAYHNMLELDPFNTEAREDLAEVAENRARYREQAYRHTRAESIRQIDETWELPSEEADGEIAMAAGEQQKGYPNVDPRESETLAKVEGFDDEIASANQPSGGQSQGQQQGQDSGVRGQNIAELEILQRGLDPELAKANRALNEGRISEAKQLYDELDDGKKSLAAVTKRLSEIDALQDQATPSDEPSRDALQAGLLDDDVQELWSYNENTKAFLEGESQAPEMNVHGRPRLNQPELPKVEIAGMDFTKDETIRRELVIADQLKDASASHRTDQQHYYFDTPSDEFGLEVEDNIALQLEDNTSWGRRHWYAKKPDVVEFDGFVDYDSDSIEDIPESPGYEDFNADFDSGFGQVSGINMIGRGINGPAPAPSAKPKSANTRFQLAEKYAGKAPPPPAARPEAPGVSVKVEEVDSKDREDLNFGLIVGGVAGEEDAEAANESLYAVMELGANPDQDEFKSLQSPELMIAEQELKVEESRLKMLDLAERYRIIDLAALQNRQSMGGDPVTGQGSILMSSMHDTYQAEAAIAQLRMQREALEGLEGEELIQSAAMLDVKDPTLASLWPKYQQTQLTRKALQESGDQAQVEKVEKEISTLRSDLEKATSDVLATLDTKLEMAEQAQRLAKGIEESKRDDTMDERRKIAEYSEASKEHELQKSMLANMLAKRADIRLGQAIDHADPAAAEALLTEQEQRLEQAETRARNLKERYDIPTLLASALEPEPAETKKNDTMDRRRKLAEIDEALKQVVQEKRLLVRLREKAPQQPAAKLPVAVSLTEKHTSREPFSTFSLHVSDVSFKLAKAALLENSQFPDAAKVRVEEFVNAFDYGDPAPSLVDKVASRTEQAAHPFRQQRNLLRVAMRTAAVGRASGTPLSLTLVLDTSGSMEREDRKAAVTQAMRVLASQLTPNDTVTLIGFSRQPRLIQDRLTGDNLLQLANLVQQTPSEGGTNLEEALLLAGEHAERQYLPDGQNRIVLITDGAANLGDADPESLKQIVVELRQKGVAFDACGVGAEGLNDSVLEALTRQGDGRYYFLDKPEDADAGFARQLGGALRPAAKNVKVQVRFNERRVGHYRLLGFEKHRLKKEDFRNDKVDAAEMAAAEAGVALYEIEPLPEGEGEIGEVSVRFQDMATGRMIERTWTIPYRPAAPMLDQASPTMQLAASAAFLAERLKNAPLAQAIRWDELASTLTHLRQHFQANQRVLDLIAMIEKAKNL